MFAILRENGNGLTAIFPTKDLTVILSRKEGSPPVSKVSIDNKGFSQSFPHASGEKKAIAEAETLFRDIVNAINDDKLLNLSDFVLKPRATKAKPKELKPEPESAEPTE